MMRIDDHPILTFARGRAVSFTFDGIPSWRFVMAFVFELAAGMAIVLTGPPRPPRVEPPSPLATKPATKAAKVDLET
jgi:hypothetical protein